MWLQNHEQNCPVQHGLNCLGGGGGKGGDKCSGGTMGGFGKGSFLLSFKPRQVVSFLNRLMRFSPFLSITETMHLIGLALILDKTVRLKEIQTEASFHFQ